MLSVLIVCRQVDEFLLRTIKSVEDLNPQIIIDISPNEDIPLGVRKNRLISVAAYEWVLVLDSDEIISKKLVNEIKNVVFIGDQNTHGYALSYENYAFNKKLLHRGEKYAKVRLFHKRYGILDPYPIHEEIIIDGPVDKLKGVIYHNSYRTFSQILIKFTKYAWQMAGEKRKSHEGVTLKKLFFYGPHMVWARVIKDEAWRDGWQGIVIAICFGYMETLMYWILLWRNLFQR